MNVKIIVAVLAFVSLAAITTVVPLYSFKYLESSNTCNNCHTMQPYVESLANPLSGSVILNHSDITCIDCHGGTTYKHRLDAQLTIAKKIGSYVLINNISGVNMGVIDVNCIDCHPAIDGSMPHSGTTACGNCHLAHSDTLLPKDFNDLECAQCHTLPSMGVGHAPINCRGCHTQHKYIPDCTQCHPPHAKPNTSDEDLEEMKGRWTNDVCLNCHSNQHSVSKNLVFGLSPDMDKELCAACHIQSDMLEIYGSFHNELQSCANCHISHGTINVRDCKTPYCHGGIAYEDYSLYNNVDDVDSYSEESMCYTCHGLGPKDPHFNAIEHVKCNDCHGIRHTTAHSRSCDSCHTKYRGNGCKGCHGGDIHKLKA